MLIDDYSVTILTCKRFFAQLQYYKIISGKKQEIKCLNR